MAEFLQHLFAEV